VQPVTAVRPGDTDRHRTGEGTDEGRQRPCALRHGHRLRQVRLPREPPYRGRRPDDEDAHPQDGHGLRHHAAQQPQHRQHAGSEHGPPLTGAGRQRSGRQVADELPDSLQRHHECRRRHRGAELPRGQGHHGQHRPLPQTEQKSRSVDRGRDPAQREGPRVLLRRLVGAWHGDESAVPESTLARRRPAALASSRSVW
jgi:hypothetical protein